MRLDEKTRDARRNRRTRQHRHEPSIAARRCPLPARLLHRMRRIENDRRTCLRHLRQRPHVDDERVVAEARAAFGDQHVWISRTGNFRDDVLHVPRREKLTLLDLDDPARRGGGDQQIGLPA